MEITSVPPILKLYNRRNKQSMAVIKDAIYRGDLEEIRHLFQRHEYEVTDSDSDRFGESLLHVCLLITLLAYETYNVRLYYAVSALQPEIIAFLIQQGADVNYLDNTGVFVLKI